MQHSDKIYIAGHRGLVGSAIWNNLRSKGYTNLIGRSKAELNLMDTRAVKTFFETEKPDYVILAAAKVGGIVANNTYRGEFIYENLMIQNNVIHAAYLSGVKKLLFLGSTCIYPRDAPQPMHEDCLLTSPLEYTNEPYAIAKIAGVKLCESYNLQYGTNFISVMPTTLYGPNDNFDLEKSHVLPGLLRKIHLGKCLEEGNWNAIREDLNRRPLGGGIVRECEGERERGSEEKVREGKSDEVKINELEDEDILSVLNKFGIKITTSLPKEVSLHVLNEVSPTLPLSISSSQPPSVPLLALSEAEVTLPLSVSHPQTVSVEIWGSGNPMREFLWSEDMADACIFIMENIDFSDINPANRLESVKSPIEVRNTHINIGTGKEISIYYLAFLIKEKVGFKGSLEFNSSKPDGTMRKLTDPSKLHQLGWHHQIEIAEGIERLYNWYLSTDSGSN